MNRIKELRKSQKISLTDLSLKTGIPKSSLSEYEKGPRSPRKKEIWEKLAEQFNVSISYIMGIKDDEQKYSNEITIEKLEYDRLLDIEKKYDAIRKLVEE